MSLGSYINLRRIISFNGAMLFFMTQLIVSISAINSVNAAAGLISATTHQGQLSPSGTYTTGNVTQYTELDKINFRFNLAGDAASTGKMQVEFTSNDTGCLFFDGSFNLGKHDSPTTIYTNVTGTAPVVTPDGPAVNNGSDWIQKLNVNFSSAGTATLNYHLKLSNQAGECSSGSPQHSRLANSSVGGGDFKNIGNQNVPIPSNQIIELPEIFIEKWVDSDADGIVDRRATQGEWAFSLDGAAAVPTNSDGKVVFTNVTPNGIHTVTEVNGPANQSFISGSGTNCIFNGSVASATVTSGTTATDATCIFNNGAAGAKLTIIKDAKPNNAQNFSFTTSGSGLSDFMLDDDANNALSNTKVFSGLATGSYSVSEASTTGWDLDKIVCDKNDGIIVNGSTVNLNIVAGDDITCTFTNLKRGSITVNKTTDPISDPTEFEITATTSNGDISGNAVRSLSTSESVIYDVAQGSYSINETDVAGWIEDDSDCQDIVINATNLSAECTINNAKLGSITIIKDAIPNTSQDFVFTFTGQDDPEVVTLDDDNDPEHANKVSFNNLPKGSYEVTEASSPGWKLTEIVCDDQKLDSTTALISLSAGENAECTFTNTKLVKISGTKFEVNSDDIAGLPGTGLGGWTIFLDLDDDGIFNNDDLTTTTDDDGTYSFEDILYGTSINLIEIIQNGWTQIFKPLVFTVDSTDDVSGLDFGNFENNKLQGNKFIDVDGDGEISLASPNLTGWTINLKIDTDDDDDFVDESVLASDVTDANGYLFEDLAPGLYQVCEVMQPGWTPTYPNDQGKCWIFRVSTSGQTFSRYFGNFQNGSVSGEKWNDINGNGLDDAEPRLSNWEITLFNDGDDDDTDLDDVVDVTNTDNTGSYSFTGLIAGEYAVCETQQNGWSQTFPAQNACHEFTIDESGEQNTANFGNQGRGSITVIKKVDADGDGITDEQDSTEWLWNIDGSGDYNTGSGNGQSVAAGQYLITEIQKDDYDLTNISCSGDDNRIQIAKGTANVVVDPGENVTCVFTNTRKTGKIRISKSLFPRNDSGVFDLNIDDVTHKKDAGHAESTEFITLPTGSYNINETAGTDTDLDDYFSSYSCLLNQDLQLPIGNSTNLIVDISDQDIIDCTFYNRRANQVNVTKFNDYNRNGIMEENEPTLPDWEMNLVSELQCSIIPEASLFSRIINENNRPCDPDYSYEKSQTTIEDGTSTFTNVKPGETHVLTETQKDNWSLSGIYCEQNTELQESSDSENELSLDIESYVLIEQNGDSVSITASEGRTVECFIGNYTDSELFLSKTNNQIAPGIAGDIVTYSLTVTVPENVDELFDVEVVDLPPESVTVIPGSETASSNIASHDVVADIGAGPQYASPGNWTIGNLVPGEIVTLTYRAQINATTVTGQYPDLAFAVGYDDPTQNFQLYANANQPSPFVGTDVEIIAPKPTPQLVDTGSSIPFISYLMSLIALATVTVLNVPKKKGGLA